MKDLPYRKELYRLWFEYLKLARSSSRTDVRAALRQSAEYYAPWGAIDGVRFDSWWKDHAGLFEDKDEIRQLDPGELPSDPSILVVQIPLTQSPTVLGRKVTAIIKKASVAASKAPKKSKKRPQSRFRPTEGTEPKLRAVRESLNVYRDVILKNPTLRGQAMLDAVRAFYKSRKRAKDVPMALIENKYNTDAGAQRNLLRYRDRAETIMLNVAKGEFPGKY